MMMAHDSSPKPPASLDRATLEAVRTAIVDYLDAPEAQSPALRDALTTMAVEARARSILPEQLLVVLKDIWYALPTIRDAVHPPEQSHLLQRIVTMCIKEYYAS
jgi:hypothetical protein